MQTKELTKESRKLPTLFNDFFKPWDEWFDNGIWFKTMNTPSVNIVEESDQFIVTLAVPGLKKKDFDIVIDDNNMLIISCEQEEEKEKEDKNFTRREYNYSSFSRSLSLPEEIKRDKIDATYEDGILKIRLPRNPEAKIHSQKRINVN